MIVYGYAKDVRYSGDGTMFVKVRIPDIHGPENRSDYNGHMVRNYVWDKDLPYYPANLLSSIPIVGDVLELQTSNEKSTDFIVSGITGGNSSITLTNVHIEEDGD